MSRLVLTRKINEAVKVGEHLVTVTRVGRGNVNLMTAKPRVVHSCALGDTVILEPGVTITLTAITGGIARLLFDVPREINIARLELLDDSTVTFRKEYKLEPLNGRP